MEQNTKIMSFKNKREFKEILAFGDDMGGGRWVMHSLKLFIFNHLHDWFGIVGS